MLQCRDSAAMATVTTDDVRVDLLLLGRIASRDAGAIGTLYDRHSRLLYSLIHRVLQDRAESEEVLQEVFLVVWNRIDNYNPQLGSPVAWLVRIARNRAIDRLRSTQVRTRAVEGVPAADPVETPESAALSTERRRAIARALATLPPEQRQLIETAYFRGLSQTELADQFQLPLGTVKTRVRTGLRTLREVLRDLQTGMDRRA